jgi:site-specific DNA-methyltransferase (adenine-specific)
MHKHGSLWIFVPDEWASETDLFCRKELGLFRRNWILWLYSFGQSAKQSFTRSHTHLLYFVKTKSQFTYNADAMKVPSARQLVYKDSRAVKSGKQPDDTWCLLKSDLESALRADGDVWSQSRICGTFKEREAHSPNQIPLPLTNRIVKACSNPGDLVCDPFLGAGGSGVSALTFGRRFIGMDISKECVEHSAARLERTLTGIDADGQMALFPLTAKKKGKRS